ncbi:MAG: hypothetical protein LBI06_00550 [Treponema sp.]|jgi:hypothetical protein|nr:hypothetical protein [Treponema sp.]
MKIKLAIVLGVMCTAGLFAQAGSFYDDDDSVPRGDAAIAENYLIWAEDAIAHGRWSQARAALERAADFADVSSDISYLLAIARSRENESRGLILQALERAIGTGRWMHYTEAQARLLQADQLIALRRYSDALRTLAVCQSIEGENADIALLRLAAMRGFLVSGTRPESGLFSLPVLSEFRRRIPESLNRYPRDSRFLRLLFDYARALDKDDGALAPIQDIVDAGLRRLPFLVESDPELVWMAAPFIANVAEARRLVAAYRAGSLRPRASGGFSPNPASIISALNLGLIDDAVAVNELFSETIIDREIIVGVGDLLRSEDGRNQLARQLHNFSGAIIDDADRDGYPESRAVYRQGNLREYYLDADQDGISDLYISFVAGVPRQAELTAMPWQGNGREEVFVFWERYPTVHRTELGGETWQPVPGGFQFAPVVFEELGATGTYVGLLFPRGNPRGQGINRRMLTSFAAYVKRPSSDFEGGTEQVLFERGIPVRAEVTLNDRIVSVTEFENGAPTVQRLDLDLDGRMETVRHFEKGSLRYVESDWYGDGIFGSSVLYRADGSVVYSLDLDGDGNREYVESR